MAVEEIIPLTKIMKDIGAKYGLHGIFEGHVLVLDAIIKALQGHCECHGPILVHDHFYIFCN